MDFNSNTPTVRGAEWRPSSSRDLLLDASTKGVAMRFKGTAATYTHLHRFISALSGTPGLGIEILSQLVPDGAGTFTARPNEDVAVGGWVNQASSGVNIYQSIDESSLDLTDYIVGDPVEYDFRVGIGSGNLAGKRIGSVTNTAVHLMTFGSVQLKQSLMIGGVEAGLQSFTWDMTLRTSVASWKANPSTAKPWTIVECELFDTGDEIRFDLAGVITGSPRVYQAYTDFNYVTENRLGSLYTTGAPTIGWLEENISDAVLSASTYYYVHVFPLAGNAANWFKVPLLKDPNVVMALNAAASTGEHRVAYSTTLDSGNGIITSATELPGEMIPMLFDAGAAIQAQSNPYCEID